MHKVLYGSEDLFRYTKFFTRNRQFFEMFELEMYEIIVINFKSNSLLYLCIFDILKHRTEVEIQHVAYH